MAAERKSELAREVCVPVPDVWDIPTWCASLRIGRSTFYTLAPKPHTVKLGRLMRIIESPGQYAQRIAGEQKKQQERAAA